MLHRIGRDGILFVIFISEEKDLDILLSPPPEPQPFRVRNTYTFEKSTQFVQLSHKGFFPTPRSSWEFGTKYVQL